VIVTVKVPCYCGQSDEVAVEVAADIDRRKYVSFDHACSVCGAFVEFEEQANSLLPEAKEVGGGKVA
jgi:hypothetical protein